MRIADLYCKAGGAAMGLHYAFPDAEIVGFDIEPQPRYPFTFRQQDALTVDLSLFHFVWASPPCQHYSKGAGKAGTRHKHRALIPDTRNLLIRCGKPWVIENIYTARHHLRNPITLCGTQFDLGVFRHRCFECSFKIVAPEHKPHTGKIGDGKYHTVAGHAGGSSKRDGWTNGSVEDWKVAMDINWMVGDELAEAVPPAFAQYIAEQYKRVAA